MPQLVHGFLGRIGGVSVGSFASLNLAYWVGDDSAHVDENWRRWREVIGDAPSRDAIRCMAKVFAS